MIESDDEIDFEAIRKRVELYEAVYDLYESFDYSEEEWRTICKALNDKIIKKPKIDKE